MNVLENEEAPLFGKNFLKIPATPLFLVVVVACWMGSAGPAAAQVETFGEVLCLAFDNAKEFTNVFEWISYVCGVIAALRGVYQLKLHADSPQNNKISTALCYLGGSAALLSLPSVVFMLENTLEFALGSHIECDAGATHPTEGLDGLITNFVNNVRSPLLGVASLTAFLCGLFMVVHGLIKASRYGTDPRTNSLHSILTNLGFGAILMAMGSSLSTMLVSVFGDATVATELSWDNFSATIGDDEASRHFFSTVNAALTFVQIIGAIAFVRGWLVMKKVVEGGSNATVAQGLTFIIGGVLAINIFEFLFVMDNTFGTGLLNTGLLN
ncbi:MAG: hypothetical protein PHS57_02820 [Alphaproteobacteria bacterium]|nr:hypothetical protein [Alphaproteobacteria bacterium]